MKQLNYITLALVLVLAIFAGSATAGTTQYYFAIASDSENRDFYYSEIFERDMSTYNSQMEDTKDFKSRLFSNPGLHSGGIIRGKTYDDAEAAIQRYVKIYEAKGYSINHEFWTP